MSTIRNACKHGLPYSCWILLLCVASALAQSGPRLTSTSLDMNAATLTLNFDVALDQSSFVASRTVLVPRATARASEGVRLNALDVIVIYPTDTQVQIFLRTDMLITIKNFGTVAQTQEDTFVLLEPAAVASSSGFLLLGNAGNAAGLDAFQPDTLPPVLLDAQLIVSGSGRITLDFDEPLSSTTVRSSRVELVLRGSSATGNPLPEIVLPVTYSEAPQFSANRNFVTLRLSPTTLNTIKALSFAPSFSPARLPIRLAADAVEDLLGITSDSVTRELRLADADAVVPNVAGASLLQGLEGNGSTTLRIRFTEPVSARRVRLAPFRLLFAVNGIDAEIAVPTLEGLTVPRVGAAVPDAAQLGDAVALDAALSVDVDVTPLLEAIRPAFESSTPRTIILETVMDDLGTFRDVSGNEHLGLQQAVVNTAGTDFVRPQLVSATLDVVNNVLILLFDKDIRPQSVADDSLLVATLRIVQARTEEELLREELAAPPSAVHSSGARELRVALASVVVQRLTPGNSADQLLVELVEGTVVDTAYNGLRVGPATLASVTPDILPPALLDFFFDNVEGTLRLVFSEPVTLASFNPTNLVLQSVSNTSAFIVNTAADLVVQPGATSPLDLDTKAAVFQPRTAFASFVGGTSSSQILVRLGWDERSIVRAMRAGNRLTDINSTFLATASEASFVADVEGNAMPAISRSAAQKATSVKDVEEEEESFFRPEYIILLVVIVVVLFLIFLCLFLLSSLRTARKKLARRKEPPAVAAPASQRPSKGSSEADADAAEWDRQREVDRRRSGVLDGAA